MRVNKCLGMLLMSGIAGCGTAELPNRQKESSPDVQSVELLMSTLMHGEIEPCG